MNREALRAALERDRDEKAKKDERTYGVDTNASADSVRFHKYWSFVHGAESRHDDILDLVEALEKWRHRVLLPNSSFSFGGDGLDERWELSPVAEEALSKLYAKYGGGK